MYDDDDIAQMVGKTMSKVYVAEHNQELIFVDENDTEYRFFHSQSCCENVYIEDICGDLRDLETSPILLAEENSNRDDSKDVFLFEGYDFIPESFTWTFYKFATINGSVTVRWLGTSNGYYSESVSLQIR